MVNSVIILSAQEYIVDPTSSKLSWKGEHYFSSKSHNGEIKIAEGKISLSGSHLNSGSIMVDVNSLTNKDLTNKEENKKLVNHLKSEDFLFAERFPTASMVIKEYAKNENKDLLVAAVTIRGITNEEAFPIELERSNDQTISIRGKLKIDREDYGIMDGWSLMNLMLEDEFMLNFTVTFRQSKVQ